MAQLKPVIHQNFISPNEQTVFCKKKHKIVKLSTNQKYCNECPYLYGLLQGNGVECAWIDLSEEPFMGIDNPQREFERVDCLVKNKILQKG